MKATKVNSSLMPRAKITQKLFPPSDSNLKLKEISNDYDAKSNGPPRQAKWDEYISCWRKLLDYMTPHGVKKTNPL